MFYKSDLCLRLWNLHSDIETSFLDLDIKVISDNIHTSFSTNAMTLHFHSLISPGWVVMFLDSRRMVFIFCSWFDLLYVVLTSLIFILKIFKVLQNYWQRVTNITSFGKRTGRFSGYTQTFCQNLEIYRFKNVFLKESLTRPSTVI